MRIKLTQTYIFCLRCVAKFFRYPECVASEKRLRTTGFNSTDLDLLALNFTNLVKQFEDNAKSYRTIRENDNKCNWYTPDLRVLKSQYMSNSDISVRKRLRNQYVAAIRRAKRRYQRQFIVKHKNSGGVWKLLRKNEQPPLQSIKIDGVTTEDKSIIAEEFKKTFTSKIIKLRKSPNIDRISEHLGEIKSWDLRSCTEEEVAFCIDALKLRG